MLFSNTVFNFPIFGFCMWKVPDFLITRCLHRSHFRTAPMVSSLRIVGESGTATLTFCKLLQVIKFPVIRVHHQSKLFLFNFHSKTWEFQALLINVIAYLKSLHLLTELFDDKRPFPLRGVAHRHFLIHRSKKGCQPSSNLLKSLNNVWRLDIFSSTWRFND